MASWFFSLQFRLIAAFALALTLALTSVSMYVGYTANLATEQFERDTEEARAERMGQFVTNYYRATKGWGGLQPAIGAGQRPLWQAHCGQGRGGQRDCRLAQGV